MVSPAELNAMRRAIALAAFGLGGTSPNPPVGCVILDSSGRVVGQGYHQRKGSAHAEANALAAAGNRAYAGTAVVTLEPCNHYGRTPPCHQALLEAGIVRAVIAVIDPTSRGEGGAARLRALGMDVQTGVLADEALLVLGPWLTAIRTIRPRLVWPYGINANGILDSRAAELGAEPLYRAADVVLHADGKVEEAVPGSHGVDMVSGAPVTLAAGPRAVMAELYQGGVRSVILNGGPELAEPFVTQGFVDQVVVHLASHESSSRPFPGSGSFLPPGFQLTETTRHEGYVRLVAVPATSNDRRNP
ncbi:MAG: bifunctional diaminohydroxyphosphoribosylaminopyrimidine deaminase/5-amino-6-(5-phosphoribosylamino)uracil reductase RibD [Pseudonocardia sp.]